MLGTLAFESSPQFLIRCDSSGHKQRGHIVRCSRSQSFSHQVSNDCVLERGNQIERALVRVREIVVELWLANRRQGSSTGLDAGVHLVRFYVAEHRRFDSAVGEIETRTVIVRIDGPAVISAAAVAMFDLCRGKLYGVRIPVGRKAVDDRSAGISETEQLGNFVECLTSGVVACVADVFVGPRGSILGSEIEMRMAARDNQGENWELNLVIPLLSLFQQ